MLAIEGSVDHEVQLRGLKFHYVEWGSPASPPLVLLHGLTGLARIWDHSAKLLCDSWHILAMDQRGHGDTAWPDPPSYETADFVADTLAFVDYLGLGQFDLMGLSMGGHNAMAFAAQNPGRVRRLVIVDIPPALRMDVSPNWRQMEHIAREGHIRFEGVDQAQAVARLGNPTAPEDNLRYRTEWNLKPDDGGKLIWKYDPKAPVLWRPADLWPEAPKLTMPCLLVRGGQTMVLPADVAQRMVREFPNLELATVEESGHSVPTDRPDELAAIVRQFLTR